MSFDGQIVECTQVSIRMPSRSATRNKLIHSHCMDSAQLANLFDSIRLWRLRRDLRGFYATNSCFHSFHVIQLDLSLRDWCGDELAFAELLFLGLCEVFFVDANSEDFLIFI